MQKRLMKRRCPVERHTRYTPLRRTLRRFSRQGRMMAKCLDWLTESHGNRNKQLPWPGYDCDCPRKEEWRGGRESASVRGGVTGPRLHGWLVKMQGFSRFWFFHSGFSFFHSAHRIDKLIFAFKLKIYICTMMIEARCCPPCLPPSPSPHPLHAVVWSQWCNSH